MFVIAKRTAVFESRIPRLFFFVDFYWELLIFFTLKENNVAPDH